MREFYVITSTDWDWERGLQRKRVLSNGGIECCVATSERYSCFKPSFWDWENGLQRKECCLVVGIECCVVTSARALFQDNPLYGTGRVEFSGKGCGPVVRSSAVLSRMSGLYLKPTRGKKGCCPVLGLGVVLSGVG